MDRDLDQEVLGGRVASRSWRSRCRAAGEPRRSGGHGVLAVVALLATMLPGALLSAAPAVSAADGVTVDVIGENFRAQFINESGGVGGTRISGFTSIPVYWDGQEVQERSGTTAQLWAMNGGGTLAGVTPASVPALWTAGGQQLLDIVNRGGTGSSTANIGVAKILNFTPDGAIVGITAWRGFDGGGDRSNLVRWQNAGANHELFASLSTAMAMSSKGLLFGMDFGSVARYGFVDLGSGSSTFQPAAGLPSGVLIVNDISPDGTILGSAAGSRFVWSEGVATPLTGLQSATAVNDDGYVVGDVFVAGQGTVAAVRAPDGQVTRLIDLIPAGVIPSGATQVAIQGVDINSSCQIAATAFYTVATGSPPRNTSFTKALRINLAGCATSTLEVTLTSPEANQAVGEAVPVSMTITNPNDVPVTALSLLGGSGSSGLVFNQDYLQLVSGPEPPPPTSLAPGQSVTLNYVLEPLRSGAIEVRGGASGRAGEDDVSSDATTRINVAPALRVELSSSVTSATRVGDEFTVTATLTNDEDVEITGISAQPLSEDPASLVSRVSGPTGATGGDPRVTPISLAAGATTTISWRLRAEQRGAVALTAQISGRDPGTGSLFFLSEAITLGIEAPALEITDLRMTPGSIVPGDTGSLRGVITNTGSVDVTDIDFSQASSPRIGPIERLLAAEPSTSPRIGSLPVGESQEFVIPFLMVPDAGGLAAYTVDLTMTGTARVGGVDTDVSAIARLAGSLDLTPYWSNILDEVRRKLLADTLDFFDGVNDWGDNSTLGGVAVGGGQGALTAFQKMGDGLLSVNDLLGEVSGDGGQRLTDDGKKIVAAAREYYHTTSLKKMVIDFADVRDDITVGGVGIFANWLRDIDVAYTAGDTRKVAALIAEPTTTMAAGFGVEQGGAQLFSKLVRLPAVRKAVSGFRRAPEGLPADIPDGELPNEAFEKVVDADFKDIKDMPTGVAISGQTVARAGLTVDEHAWMIEMAQEHGVAFFVRPRPEQAARWARLGYNAKPMAIKLKSLNDIDIEWLGFDDYVDKQGIVVFREPKDPYPAMKAAVEAGDLEYGGKEIDDIIARYNVRRAEWASRNELLEKLNAGDGFDVQRYGKTIKTKVTIDPDGLLRFTYNNKPIFSDIDLLHIAKPDGTNISPELHRKIAESAGFGIDSQHGDSVATSDFPNWEVAKKFAVQYADEHRRGGDPLVIVQPDVTTLGYVDTLDVPVGDLPGSGYDLYGKITTTYEGAGSR